MRKSILFIIFWSIFLGACQSRTNFEKPEDLIPPEKMEDLLYDIYLANAAGTVDKSDEMKTKGYLSMISEKYGIDSTRFSKSNLYYSSKVDEYGKIFENVKLRLESTRDSLRKLTDSIHQLDVQNKIKLKDSIFDDYPE